MSQLIIDTSTNNTLLALDHRNIAEEVSGCADNTSNWDSSSKLIRALDRVAKMKGVSDISSVIVGTGPGSYTGLRVGFSTAKMWAYAYQLPLFGVSSLFAFSPTREEILVVSKQNRQIAIAIDARGGGIYALAGQFDEIKGTVIWKLPAIVPWKNIADFSKHIDSIYQPISQSIEKRWEQSGGKEVNWRSIEPRAGNLMSASANHGIEGTWKLQYRELELNYLK